MNERIKDYLGHEEKVLWNGQAEDFQAMDKTHKNYYIRRGIIVAIISVAVIAAYFISAISAYLQGNLASTTTAFATPTK